VGKYGIFRLFAVVGIKMQKTIDYIRSKTDIKPEIGLILGSGLGDIAEEIKGVKIPYSEIPGFEAPTIYGHAGQLVIGEFCSKKVVAMQGRFHYYEGHSVSKVVFPVRVMKKLGIDRLIVTNAAGGVNKEFKAGDLMIIEDHLNLMGTNPLIGRNDDEFGARFPDMSCAYNKDLIKIVQDTAKILGMEVKKGIYAGLTGPSYETPSEIRMLRILGADAVGMSTVPEVITANHAGMKVLGISCITNMAAGILDQPLSHTEVIDTTNRVKTQFVELVKAVVERV
jgi:purine-nucleoside phosphorylase